VIRGLGDLRSGDEAAFGGKSANLGELLAAGFNVPGGFAIAGTAEDAEIAAEYEALGEDVPVAVRSSAVGEDSADATFAGMQESYLWVRGAADVCARVHDCWASLHSERATAYRERMAGGRTPEMGVTVQRMVEADVSGVLFTCNPVSGDPSTVAINASWGLGLAVVGGEVTPDAYFVSKVTGEVVKRTVSDKHVEYRHTDPIRVDDERRHQPCLDDAQIAQLAELGRRVQKHFGSHQDVEWAFAGGELFVLQARPVTVKREAPTATGDALSMVMGTFGARTDGTQ
jgi:pyruvate,water dikinase